MFLLAIVTRGGGGGGRGASPGDGCRVETPGNDRQTEHAVRGGVRKFKLLRPAHFLEIGFRSRGLFWS